MAEKFFRFPFAVTGDKTAVPDPEQMDGSVSYEKGFTFDYERDQATDPAAKDVPREESNSIYYEVTNAIRQLQTTSAPSFITSAANGGTPFSYAKSVRVWFDDGSTEKLYQSLVDSNTADPTDATKWQEVLPVQSIPDASTTVKGIVELTTGAEALAGSDTTRAVTSSALASLLSHTTNGYMGLPGGLILQWGTLTNLGPTLSGTVTFPIAFTTACYAALMSKNASNAEQRSDTASSITTTSFVINNGSPSETATYRWFAIGK